MAIYDPHPDHDVEIETFGLVPEFTGKGLGGYALTLAVRQGWDLAPGTRRVWLHTSSADNPNALPNFHRRGFRTFKTRNGQLTQQGTAWLSYSPGEGEPVEPCAGDGVQGPGFQPVDALRPCMAMVTSPAFSRTRRC